MCTVRTTYFIHYVNDDVEEKTHLKAFEKRTNHSPINTDVEESKCSTSIDSIAAVLNLKCWKL